MQTPMLTQVERELMVAPQIEARGVTDPRVLDAMRAVPREAFVPRSLARLAYNDAPLASSHGQTISGARALKIGTGSGYGAAVLSRIAAEV